MLKRKSLAVLLSLCGCAIASGTSFAHSPAPVVSENNNNSNFVTIPNLKPGFELAITALALKPSATNLNYAILNKELPAQTPTWVEREVNPSYGAAFELGGRYVVPNQANDVSLTWTHLNSSTSTSVNTPDASYFIGPDYEIGPAGITMRSAYGNANFKYDMVHLDAGQYVDFGRHVEMRFFGGLGIGFLREDVKAQYAGNVLAGTYAGPFSSMSENYSNFTGVGPRIGMRMDYNADYGFGFLGEAAVSALIGNSHSALDFVSSGQQLLILYGQINNYQSIVDKDTTQVVPGIDGKLGVQYKRPLCNGSLLTVQAGYQAAVYINAINQYKPGSLVAGAGIETGGIFVATMNHTLSNYSVQGPFLSLAFQV